MWILRIAFARAPTQPLEFYYQSEAACREQYLALTSREDGSCVTEVNDAHGRTTTILLEGIQHVSVVDFQAELTGRIELGLAQTRAQEAFQAKREAGMLIRAPHPPPAALPPDILPWAAR